MKRKILRESKKKESDRERGERGGREREKKTEANRFIDRQSENETDGFYTVKG